MLDWLNDRERLTLRNGLPRLVVFIMWDEVADEGDSAAAIVELEEGIERKNKEKER